jgi:hypothetical protein
MLSRLISFRTPESIDCTDIHIDIDPFSLRRALAMRSFLFLPVEAKIERGQFCRC